MQDFLQLSKQSPTTPPAHATKAAAVAAVEKKVELRVVLPDRSTVTVTIQEFWRTPEVYEVSPVMCIGRGHFIRGGGGGGGGE